MYSNNGTNFVGAGREFRECLEAEPFKMDVKDKCRKERTKWKFQPPEALHFGGAHGRLVRAVKRSLYRVLEIENKTSRNPTEEVLCTLLFELIGLLNGQLLTHSSSDAEKFRPITPNDLLYRPSRSDDPQDISTIRCPVTAINTFNV